MLYLPFQALGALLRGLLAIAVIAGGVWLLHLWDGERSAPAPETPPRVVTAPEGREVEVEAPPSQEGWQLGFNRGTAYLGGAALLLLFAAGGGLLFSRLPGLLAGVKDEDRPVPPGGAVHEIARPDGTRLHVEVSGSPDAPPLILTHGWGLDGKEWCYVRRELARTHRVIVWDLPGLGRSRGPADSDWSLEKMAHDLEAVLGLAAGRPAVLVGHSIGGMITLTFCRLFPEALGTRVSGLVLVHSTYTNPVRTTTLAPLYSAIQKPVLEPLCHLMIWLAPLFWLMNVLSYLNGSAHRSMERDSFSGSESRPQLEFVSAYVVRDWPAVLARGFLGMFRYDATETLPRITVPALLVAADEDGLCLPEASRHMSERIPGARLVTLRRARHCGHFEYHEEFARELAAFVAVCQPAPEPVPA